MSMGLFIPREKEGPKREIGVAAFKDSYNLPGSVNCVHVSG